MNKRQTNSDTIDIRPIFVCAIFVCGASLLGALALASVYAFWPHDLDNFRTGRPNTPEYLTISLDGQNTATLRWTTPQTWRGTPDKSVTCYVITRTDTKKGDEELVTVAVTPGPLEYVDRDREYGTRYFYSIRAVNRNGEGKPTRVLYADSP